MIDNKIKVVVAEDSPTARTLLIHLLESDPSIQVVGAACDGAAAVRCALRKRPDVILMDIHMPVMDGFEATRQIMETQAIPIVVCTAVADPKQVDITFRSLEAGAVACIKKPVAPVHKDFQEEAEHLLSTIKLMSEVKVVRRTSRTLSAPARSMSSPAPAVTAVTGRESIKLVGIGSSTGGPPVLQTILTGLPRNFPVPLLVVQHIASGFLPGMAQWLSDTTGFNVQIASYGIQPLPRHVYLAPDDYHMGVGADMEIILTRQPPLNHLRPSVSFLFRSLAERAGSGAIGVILTGMGKDGAEELRLMRAQGAITIAQDKETSVVHGMPGHAIALGAAVHVLPPDRIASILTSIVSGHEH